MVASGPHSNCFLFGISRSILLGIQNRRTVYKHCPPKILSFSFCSCFLKNTKFCVSKCMDRCNYFLCLYVISYGLMSMQMSFKLKWRKVRSQVKVVNCRGTKSIRGLLKFVALHRVLVWFHQSPKEYSDSSFCYTKVKLRKRYHITKENAPWKY